MAIRHAAPGDVVDVRPLGHALRESDSETLIRTSHLEDATTLPLKIFCGE